MKRQKTSANPADDGVALFALDDSTTVSHLEIYDLTSVWAQSSQAADVLACG